MILGQRAERVRRIRTRIVMSRVCRIEHDVRTPFNEIYGFLSIRRLSRNSLNPLMYRTVYISIADASFDRRVEGERRAIQENGKIYHR